MNEHVFRNRLKVDVNEQLKNQAHLPSRSFENITLKMNHTSMAQISPGSILEINQSGTEVNSAYMDANYI